MALVTIKPTHLDRWVAEGISKETDPRFEHAAEALTWGADEHVLLAASAFLWLATRHSDEGVKRFTTHCLVTTAVASALPHLLKTIFDQERPDRKSFAQHRRGIPYSGKPKDAFPSGHAVHMGALASLATLLPHRWKYGIWMTGSVLVTTRVALLAHWVSDIAAGIAVGIGLERTTRLVTHPPSFPRRNRRRSH